MSFLADIFLKRNAAVRSTGAIAASGCLRYIAETISNGVQAMKDAATLLLLLAAGCAAGDRITFVFADASAQAEAVSLDISALRMLTQSGATLDCGDLLEQRRRPDDGDIVVAQHVSVPVPLTPGQSPFLTQLPQERYAFLAEAHDRFGFAVARGCAVDDVTARRPLDLSIRLRSVPAPMGALEAVAATEWLQHAGSPGLDNAPALSVRARDPAGQPLPGVEVRALVESGNSVVLTSLLTTADSAIELEDGVASTYALAQVGTSRILLHARGLANSPIAFTIDGVAVPVYQTYADRTDKNPIALLAADFYFDSDHFDDLLAIETSASSGYSELLLWGNSWHRWQEQQLKVRIGPAENDTRAYLPKLAVSGLFDGDDRPDFVTVEAAEREALIVHFHLADQADRLHNGSFPAFARPADSMTIHHVVPLRLDTDALTDLVLDVSISSSTAHAVLVYRNSAAGAGFEQVQYLFDVPASFGEHDFAAGDVNGDGDDELLLLTAVTGIWLIPNGEDRSGTGSGRFYTRDYANSWPRIQPGDGNHYVAVADIDSDGASEVVAVSDGYLLGTPALRVLGLRDDFTRFEVELEQGLPSPLRIDHFVLDDLNADGNLDALVISNDPPQRALMLSGDGNNRFTAPLIIDVGIDVVDVAVADFNRDGIADLGFFGSSTHATFLQVFASDRLIQ